MDIDVFRPDEFDVVARVLRTALNPAEAIGPAERSFLDTYALICGRRPLRAVPALIDAREVRIDGPHPRKRLLQLAALAVLLSRPVRPASLRFLKALAAALEVHDAVLDVIDALVKGQHWKVRLLATRRVMRVMLKEAYLAEGAMGVVRVLAAMAFKAPVNKDRLWSYKKLGLLPEGSVGREYWKHMTREGFGFPGDVAGIPRSISYHDVAHVLTGYQTNPQGEIQQGAFQAGNRREDGFFFVQMVVLQFHQGLKVTPAADGALGHFHPDQVLWAIHRGARCTVDMTHQWDYWPLMPATLDEARAGVELLPRLDAAGSALTLREAA